MGGNKIKDARSNFMPKSEAEHNFGKGGKQQQQQLDMVSEENLNYSNTEMPGYYDQLEIFKSMYDEEDFRINEEQPSDT